MKAIQVVLTLVLSMCSLSIASPVDAVAFDDSSVGSFQVGSVSGGGK